MFKFFRDIFADYSLIKLIQACLIAGIALYIMCTYLNTLSFSGLGNIVFSSMLIFGTFMFTLTFFLYFFSLLSRLILQRKNVKI